ncbi:uncharacterized protein LOC125228277 [Leguminivora glycinivorella]|uniref:uncharacterized protein LOC125228277 n=1 Tax=Leguminivora glycinivorella TaxID=1035111 RepID=UPI00200FB3A5|nr:uncharacterized protein LOC125228277 [Leguminivora glycinivorella]
MNLHTPRRRISPRARRRYRAIKNFFQKTLSSLTSVSGNKLNSSTTENVTNLNRSDVMGHQLHAAPQYHHGLHSAGNVYRRHTEDFSPRDETCAKQRRRRFSEQEFIPNGSGTKVLYKTADNLCRNSHECGLRFYDEHSDREPHLFDGMNYGLSSSNHDVPNHKIKKNKLNPQENLNRRKARLRKRGAPIIMEDSVSGFDSYESLTTPVQTNPGRTYREPVPQNGSSYTREEAYHRDVQPDVVKIKKRREKPKRQKSKSPHIQERRKKKKTDSPANEEKQFIADIINRQYKPLSFFGRRASDISQISTPVCRDQRYSTREMVIPDSEVSSFSRCPAGGCRHGCAADVRDMRSLCDTRLHSSPWPVRQRHRRAENYNDSNFYDVVPVKEKTSPKSRRKFMEDNLTMNVVPPSPRTHRPRLILETQNYSEYEDDEHRENQMRKRRSPSRRPEYEYTQTFRHDVSTEDSPRNINEMSPKFERHPNNNLKLHDDMGTTMSSQHNTTSQDNSANNTLNHDKDNSIAVDKTDKALSEIKDILQNFLQELKKDSSTSQCDRVSGSDKNSGKQLDGTLRGSDNETMNAMKNSVGSSFNCGLGQGCASAMPPPFMPGFANPCCYPQVIPMYGAHGVPYLVASPSCVCANAACGHNHPRPQPDTRDAQCRTCSKVNVTESEETTKTNCETDVLIREIYNYVARNPTICKESKPSQDHEQSPERKPSVGKSMHALHQDANVGTPPLRCYSKSCEAIVSRQHFDTYYATYPSYSESLLEERLSRETVMDYQMPRETNEYNFKEKKTSNNLPKQHSQDSKFSSALRLLRKHSKKNKRENIHEVCHSEQSIEVDVVPKGNAFNQEFATYAMHGQEFLRPPPPRHDPRCPPTYDHDYSPYDSQMTDYSSPRPVTDRYNHYDRMPPEGPVMYDNSYGEQCSHPTPPPGPLCLKEIEVRSVGTQIEKKTTFRMFSQKKEKGDDADSPPPRPLVSILRNKLEDTKSDTKPGKGRKLFNVKPQATASKSEPMASLTEKIQKDITKNDNTISTAMLRKLFYKRNPFSPQNRFVRTIMEKDTPVYTWRPRLFL